MHISLDSELGRQRRLNQIGESISSIAAPTAAYSLRSITGGDPKAVRVRRVRNDEQDFTVSGVSSGALVDFVLGNTKSLLNSRAYFDGSNDEVDLTSDIDLTGDFSIQFSLVVTVKDQRILGKKTLMFLAASGNNEIESFKGNLATSGFTLALTSNLKYGEENTVKFKRVSGKIGMYNESDTLISNEITTSETFTVNSFGKARGQFGKGVIHSIRIDTNGNGTIDHSYNGYGNTLSDWTDLVGSNNASAVNGSPALFTGQDQDGFVETWYDQSGNGLDAVQATASKQPFIVESGSLNVDSFSNPTIRFEKDSETHLITTDSTLDPNLEVSAFVVQKDEQVENANSAWVAMRRSDSSGRSSAFEMAVNNNSLKFRLIYDPLADDTNKNDVLVTVASDGLGTTSIMSGIKTSSGDLDGFFNGSSVIDTTVTDNTDLGSSYGITMGKHTNSSQFADGRLNEVIFYLSDQTANRSAIETNLANHYGITLL